MNSLSIVSKLIFILFTIISILSKEINAALPRESEPDPVCAESPDSGYGEGLIHQWYFNVEVSQCREMVYRGSAGNLNRFGSLAECEYKCLRHYIEGAEEVGPKIKAPVNHMDKASDKVYAYRLSPMERRKIKNRPKHHRIEDNIEQEYNYFRSKPSVRRREVHRRHEPIRREMPEMPQRPYEDRYRPKYAHRAEEPAIRVPIEDDDDVELIPIPNRPGK